MVTRLKVKTLTSISPSTSQINAGRQLLSKLVSEKQMSPEGKAWLTFALDPFHDKDIKGVQGIPDSFGGKSVICSVVQEIQIKKPDTIVGNWGCRIATYPVATTTILNRAKTFSNVISYSTEGPYIIAPVQITYAADGTDFSEFGINADVLSIPQAFTKGPFKVGAFGLEVVNTTADLQRQGLVTCARMNQTSLQPYTAQIYPNNVAYATYGSVFPIRTVPKNLQEMTLLTGNTAWKAAEGAYSVIALKNHLSTAPIMQPKYPLLCASDMASGDCELIDCAIQGLTQAVVPGLGPAVSSVYWSQTPGELPSDSTIIMFTGLSEQSTLTVRARWMIERYPNDQESEIVVLANPTASFDPIALEIYSQVMQQVPAAVMFSENPEGEWWKQVLGTLADVVGTGLLAIPHPVAKAAGAAALMANKTFNPQNSTMKTGKSKDGTVKAKKRKNPNKPSKDNTGKPVPIRI